MRFIRVDKYNNVEVIDTDILPIDYIENEYRRTNPDFFVNEKIVIDAPDLIELYDDGVSDTASDYRYILRKPKFPNWNYDELLDITEEDVSFIRGIYNKKECYEKSN